jgi:trans-aconitate methyltransferase
MTEQWKFDHSVADIFVDHARQHIPNYETVIAKSINLANFALDKTAKILDFGCATGRTLEQFKLAGYNNLYGIDNSQPMLDKCCISADYLCADTVPDTYNDFDMILANWTLHFVNDKTAVLDRIVSALKPASYFILSEKVSTDPLLINMYHEWKFAQGVSREAIELKSRTLDNVMKPQTNAWWLEILNQRFDHVSIMDADWCFCSYLCIK